MDGGGERAQDTGSRSVYDRQLASVRTPNVSDEVPLDECHCTPLPGAPPPAARACTPPPYPIRVSSRAECEGRQRELRGTAQPRRITICREAAPLSLSHHVGQHSPIAPLCGATADATESPLMVSGVAACDPSQVWMVRRMSTSTVTRAGVPRRTSSTRRCHPPPNRSL
jgi:hypothetical protein